jgi:iron complex transport system substrate-binding protein
MKNLWIVILLYLLYGCVEHTIKEVDETLIYPSQEIVEVKYATGFSVDVSNENFTKININSGGSSHNFSDSIYIPHNPNFSLSDKIMVPSKINNLGIQSSTYLAYLQTLNKLDLVKGVCGMDYITDKELIGALKKNKALEMSLSGSIQTELLLKVNPDLFLIYPFELQNAEKYNSQGVKTLLISEYLEESALARLEWIKLFGLLLGQNELAHDYFERVDEDYSSNINDSVVVGDLMFNLPFKDNWNMPSSNSFVSNLTKDAGLKYIYNDGSYDNVVRTKETVWNDGAITDYWVIIANRPEGFDLKQLIEEDVVYSSFKSVKNNQVIFCNTSTTNYFTKGVVEPDIMLKDLLFATGQIEDHSPIYFKILK